jgi:hypothetical protein
MWAALVTAVDPPGRRRRRRAALSIMMAWVMGWPAGQLHLTSLGLSFTSSWFLLSSSPE